MDAARRILHVDMDAFYASIEQRDDPTLRGLPVVVGGDTRGVVAAASYEAREFGIRSAMPMVEARRRCPTLVRIRPRMAHYQAVSRDIFDVFREFTPQIEGLSLDEAFLDVTASEKLFGDPVAIAREIKSRIRKRTGLTASVGVAANKLVAKIASDMDKPDGLVVIEPGDAQAKLDPLPVQVIPGIGPETLARLERVDIHRVRDLRCAPQRTLDALFGRYAARMRQRAAGIDDRPVGGDRAERSISAENTFADDLRSTSDMERELLRLTERTAARLRRGHQVAGTVRVKIRDAAFHTVTRQQRLSPPGAATDQIYAVARRLLGRWLGANPDARVRLLGVGVSRLSDDEQQDLFNAADHAAGPVDSTVDRIRERFGDASVSRARTLGPREP